jgi:hypothetical protein
VDRRARQPNFKPAAAIRELWFQLRRITAAPAAAIAPEGAPLALSLTPGILGVIRFGFDLRHPRPCVSSQQLHRHFD